LGSSVRNLYPAQSAGSIGKIKDYTGSYTGKIKDCFETKCANSFKKASPTTAIASAQTRYVKYSGFASLKPELTYTK
jgi:hypothetical protein